ncbi:MULTISPECIES: hypothetical protein [unclassified Dysgonomonas]|jgi:hypothetical protein|uniref:hypothetical protein n=1 Tax=unclassified Dysgonomonas TaxID=2630389 RepID=UPI0025BB7EFC|nr:MULTISPECIES: hypothetical protein [unclassified Dysgonomonas]MDR2004905.1 hypothetical protein [Prevotella sp.]HMM01681.1 hypothetical protein [Dysgonomonas sp.]
MNKWTKFIKKTKDEWTEFVEKTKKFFTFWFYLIFGILFIFTIIFFIITTIEFINKHHSEDFDLHKDSIISFLDFFNPCLTCAGVWLAMYSVYYALNTFKVHDKNRKINEEDRILKPFMEKFFIQLDKIKDDKDNYNLKMYSMLNFYGKMVIRHIVSKEKENEIKSKEQLQCYFNKYIKKYIPAFEYCGYYGHKCRKIICMGKDCKEKDRIIITYFDPQKPAHSFDEFEKIAYDLFCISFEYTDFEKDIKELYTEKVEEFKKSFS